VNNSSFKNGSLFTDYAEDSEFEEQYRNTTLLDADKTFFSSFAVNVLCISEKWCKDCKREVPLLAYIADKAGWHMRIFGMDDNPDLMEHYTTDGKNVIPVFVFFDAHFTEIGRFIEKPPEGKTTIDMLKEILGK
jgi:thiol-disulfide isomerase/thioredoxin